MREKLVLVVLGLLLFLGSLATAAWVVLAYGELTMDSLFLVMTSLALAALFGISTFSLARSCGLLSR